MKTRKTQCEAVNRMEDNTMSNIKRTKRQTMIYKILHRKIKKEHVEPTINHGWTIVHWTG